MKLSVVIPVYNVEEYLDQALSSVLGQTYQDFEVVLVNDGSTDSSGEMCRAFKQRIGDRVVLVEQENSGLLMARRAGFAAAHGDAVVSLDSDDMLREDALQRIAECFERYDVDLVLYGASRKEDFSSFYADEPFDEDTYVAPGQKKVLCDLICGSRKLNSMWSKSIGLRTMDLDHDYSSYRGLSYAEDLLQSLPVIDRARSAYYIHEPLYYYRVNYSSLTKRFDPDQEKARKAVWDVQMRYARKWAEEFDDRSLVDAAIGLALQSFTEMAQAASEGLPGKEALAFISSIADSDDFREAYEHPGSLGRLRSDFRAIARLMAAGKYRRVYGLSRAKGLVRKKVLGR